MSLDDIINDANDAVNVLNAATGNDPTGSFESDGFLLPATFSADGNGLPYTQAPTFQSSVMKRNIITWFVPEFGIVRMYVNPASIIYSHKKLIGKDRTKGGYTLQYWGEELSSLNISGTTGSAGIEGINVLYELYRAEQYGFDSTGLSLAAANAAVPNTLNSLLGTTGDISTSPLGAVGTAASALGSLVGMDSPNTALIASSINSLAQMAFTVEMYYNGWVYRGFFESMTVNEQADDFLIKYQMTFTVTQRRGYRLNYFPWSRSASNGPSQYTSPSTFNGSVTVG